MAEHPSPVRFFVGNELPAGEGGPRALLRPDNWDDYSYKTSFDLELHYPGEQRAISIGPLKILARNYPPQEEDSPWPRSRTLDVIPKNFELLDPSLFCSLGQASDYYGRLGSLVDPTTARQILVAVNDVCFAPSTVQRWWEESGGFTRSLLRYPDAHVAKRKANALLEGRDAEEENIHSISLGELSLAMEISPTNVEFRFDGKRRIPSRFNVVVGRNGVGKSLLLSRLAAKLTSETPISKETYVPRFSRVVYVSYNAFDTSVRRVAGWERSSLRFVGYKPGNFEFIDRITTRAYEEYSKKTPDAVWQEFLREAIPKAQEWLENVPSITEQKGVLVELLKRQDWLEFIPNAMDDLQIGAKLATNPQEALELMSPGQRVLAGLYAGLFTHLDRRSLLLIDEPENHLHPSMLASFIRHLATLLDARQSYAIIVTHSPVVLQETPCRDVFVMRREGDTSFISKPSWETFGDSVDNITQYLFETDFKNSNWKAKLQEQIESGASAADIERELGGELPLLARTFVERLLARR